MALFCWLMEGSPLRWLGYMFVLSPALPHSHSTQAAYYSCRLFNASVAYILMHIVLKMSVNNDCPQMCLLAMLDVLVFHALASVLAALAVVRWVTVFRECQTVNRMVLHIKKSDLWKSFIRCQVAKRLMPIYKSISKIKGLWTVPAISLMLLIIFCRPIDAAVNALMDNAIRDVYKYVLPASCTS